MLKKTLRKLVYLVAALTVSAVYAGSYEDYFRAIENNDPATVRSLLTRGFDPNTRNESGQVGLFLAFRGGSLAIADVLTTHPHIQLDAANVLNETPLMMAALRGHLDWVRKLLDLGVKAHREGWTPLHYAATGPESKVVGLLLMRGASIDAVAPDGSTSLMMAATFGSEDSVEVLLSRGANPSLRNARGHKAAELARAVGRESLAARLERATRP